MREFQRKIYNEGTARGDTDDSVMQRTFGTGERQVRFLIGLAHNIRGGAAIGERERAILGQIFANVPPDIIRQRCDAIDAAGKRSPLAAYSLYVRAIAPDSSQVQKVDDFIGRASRNILASELRQRADRRDDEQARRRGIDPVARIEARDPRERARQADDQHRRSIIEREMSKRFPEPDRFQHADRMELAAHVLHSGRPTTVKDAVRAAYASHEALNYGKEQGILPESAGIPSQHGPIGSTDEPGEMIESSDAGAHGGGEAPQGQ